MRTVFSFFCLLVLVSSAYACDNTSSGQTWTTLVATGPNSPDGPSGLDTNVILPPGTYYIYGQGTGNTICPCGPCGGGCCGNGDFNSFEVSAPGGSLSGSATHSGPAFDVPAALKDHSGVFVTFSTPGVYTIATNAVGSGDFFSANGAFGPSITITIGSVTVVPNGPSACSGLGAFPNEGAFNDLTSLAPAGHRVNIHSFGYRCDDSSTVSSQYYFKSGPSAGFEQIRWPWILHFQESHPCTAGALYIYEPLPLVIGEQPVGYLTFVDPTHDLRYFGGTSQFGDSFLRVDPGPIISSGVPFASGSQTGQTADVCFYYSLDQFGSLARTSHGFELRGFHGDSVRLSALGDGVYNLLSHRSLTLSARLVSSVRGAPVIAEAGLSLADGHSFRLEASRHDSPLLEVTLPSGEVQPLLLDEAMASRIDALDLTFVDSETAIKTQLFASSFGSREACLQDPMLARYYDLGDLDDLDNTGTFASARVTLVSEAFEVTLVVLTDEASTSESTVKVLSHQRRHLSSSDSDTTETLSADEAPQGLLGVTAQANWHLALVAEEHMVARDSVLSTSF